MWFDLTFSHKLNSKNQSQKVCSYYAWNASDSIELQQAEECDLIASQLKYASQKSHWNIECMLTQKNSEKK